MLLPTPVPIGIPFKAWRDRVTVGSGLRRTVSNARKNLVTSSTQCLIGAVAHVDSRHEMSNLIPAGWMRVLKGLPNPPVLGIR